jgi:hypothetical protein
VEQLTRRRALGAALAGATLMSASGAGDDRRDNPLAGSWTYRSFINDPDPSLPFNDLEFAVAELRFDDAPDGQLSGRLGFGSDYLQLKGSVTYGSPFSLRFQGVGATPGTIEDRHPWIYTLRGQ